MHMTLYPDAKSIGKRLAILRLARNYKTQAEIAHAIGAEHRQYHVWEKGRGKIPIPYAIRLKELLGVTLDYIYVGDTRGLPSSLVRLIEKDPVKSLGNNSAPMRRLQLEEMDA
jgi:DNA-binding XRE family transcriptional regulator